MGAIGDYIERWLLPLLFTFLFITNLIAITFIATDDQINKGKPLVIASYIGIGSTVIICGLGAIIYWYFIIRGKKGNDIKISLNNSSSNYGKTKTKRRR